MRRPGRQGVGELPGRGVASFLELVCMVFGKKLRVTFAALAVLFWKRFGVLFQLGVLSFGIGHQEVGEDDRDGLWDGRGDVMKRQDVYLEHGSVVVGVHCDSCIEGALLVSRERLNACHHVCDDVWKFW